MERCEDKKFISHFEEIPQLDDQHKMKAKPSLIIESCHSSLTPGYGLIKDGSNLSDSKGHIGPTIAQLKKKFESEKNKNVWNHRKRENMKVISEEAKIVRLEAMQTLTKLLKNSV